MEEAVSKKRKAFVAAHRIDKDRQAYVFASWHASSVIAKDKAETWQATCSSFLPKANPKSVYSLLRSVAGSSSLSSSSPNFSNCSSPRQLASVFVDYPRSHFSVSQPKALRSRARVYLLKLRRVTCYEETHSSFCSSFSLAKFFCGCHISLLVHCHWPRQSCLSMLKHLPHFDMDFFLHICNLSWSLHFFPSIWKTSSIIGMYKMGKPLDCRASFRPISLTSCVSKLFERIILSSLLFFLKFNFILSSRQSGFCPVRSTTDQILFLAQSISDRLSKPKPFDSLINYKQQIFLGSVSFWIELSYESQIKNVKRFSYYIRVLVFDEFIF